MTPRAQTIADVIVIAVALWFLLGAGFADMPARTLLNTVALFVILSSLWRIWRRHRGAP
ncbi:hypothetical protein [Jannaschia donghaensis]|uniref:Uncharacterized protein n=1 Tax=Jannaschia donghaensis TaxID=420998 RepID=A0A0M6YG65_9RHOB|nr:hypothetical protein [Jannaschia donghaensis]CTQ48769.1 hypothetical protein JDO7802_00774 [Jannaschia donghaensis]